MSLNGPYPSLPTKENATESLDDSGSAVNSIQDNPSSSRELSYAEELTVLKKAKYERYEESPKTTSSVWFSFLKWILTLIMFFMTLTCLVLSKIGLVLVGKDLSNGTLRNDAPELNVINNTVFNGTLSDKDVDADVSYTMILLIMWIPRVISFLRAFCNSNAGIRPSGKALIWGAVASFLESLGLCLFSLIIVGFISNEPLHSILLMNGIFIIPVLYQVYREIRRRYWPSEEKEEKSVVTLLRYVVATMLSLLGFATIAIGIVDMDVYDSEHLHHEIPMVFVFFLCLSAAWSPKMMKMQVEVATEEISPTNHGNFNTPRNSAPSEPTIVNMGSAPPERTFVNMGTDKKTSRTRITLVTSVLKIFFVTIFAFIINFRYNVAKNSDPGIALKNGFNYFTDDSTKMAHFFIQVFASLFGYILCWLACTMDLQKICFVIPLSLATPVSVAVVVIDYFLLNGKWFGETEVSVTPWWMIIMGSVLWLSEFTSLAVQMFTSHQFLMAKEDLLFWLPSYDALLLEQHLLLNRKNEAMDVTFIDYQNIVKKSHIYICTTMYQEADYEMKQLLESLAMIDLAQDKSGRNFEAHIWLDDGVKHHEIHRNALQLLSLMTDAMGIDPDSVTNIFETPYGLQMRWKLKKQMPFFLHLKDNLKVKNKKRWSQIMYMSYVLDFVQKQKELSDDLTYILATDADVKFSPKDVMSLMDLMSRNNKVAAVCGRTQPMGSGALVWYQIFDYAIGHWLLKVANHVFGSVLCSPGCFSVYRARAIRDVLPLYAGGTETAMDFLIKDMGEDRWFCSLLVEAGWKLEYCAASKDSTFAPMEFDEFYKQRRRWGPSTIANSLILLENQKLIRQRNDAINLLFIVYQFLLIASTAIGPATVLLIIAGGLNSAYGTNLITVLVLEVVITIAFTVICLYYQNIQLTVAKWLTFVSSVIMIIVTVGLIKQAVENFNALYETIDLAKPCDIKDIFVPTQDPFTPIPSFKVTRPPKAPCNETIIDAALVLSKLSSASIYLTGMVAIYFLTALLHPSEFMNLVHGIWYFWALPSGSLFLTIYSVVNLIDRSWGTREGSKGSQSSKSGNISGVQSWYTMITDHLMYWFQYCIAPKYKKGFENSYAQTQEVVEVDAATDCNEKNEECQEKANGKHRLCKHRQRKMSMTSISENDGVGESGSHPDDLHPKMARDVESVEELLEKMGPQYKGYAKLFKKEGYDDVSFIAGFITNEAQLDQLGIDNQGHRNKLMGAIKELHHEEFNDGIPDNVRQWLVDYGLGSYWPRFLQNSFNTPKALAKLKTIINHFPEKKTNEEIRKNCGIYKTAHLRKFKKAISVLHYPTRAQELITKVRGMMKKITICKMNKLSPGVMVNNVKGEDLTAEHTFWSDLRAARLKPEETAFNNSDELKEKLADLRNKCLFYLFAANAIWLTFVLAVMGQKSLNVFDSSALSLIFLSIYTLVLLFQFVALLLHRFTTLLHFIARAPFTPGRLKTNWSWDDDDDLQNKRTKELVARQRITSTSIIERKASGVFQSRRVEGISNEAYVGETETAM